MWDMWDKRGCGVGQSEEERRAWDTERERERKRLYRERKKAEVVDPDLPEVDVSGAPEALGSRPLAALLKLAPADALSESEEQALRDHFGYAQSETRTRAEREKAASGMLGKTPGMSLEDYVAHNVAVARGQMVRPRDVAAEDFDSYTKDSLQQVEKYARWRYAGVLDGSVGTL